MRPNSFAFPNAHYNDQVDSTAQPLACDHSSYDFNVLADGMEKFTSALLFHGISEGASCERSQNRDCLEQLLLLILADCTAIDAVSKGSGEHQIFRWPLRAFSMVPCKAISILSANPNTRFALGRGAARRDRLHTTG
jgi:hypothetical protein